jgi:S-formylglutathione hydrolase
MRPGWSRESIAGKPADVFDPPGRTDPRFAVLFLHAVGLESPAENEVYTAALSRHGLAGCAPHGGRSWWTDRVCREFDPVLTAERYLLDHVRPWMSRRWPTAAIAAAGISMGGQGALRLGFKYPDRFPVVAGVSSAIDYHQWYGRGTPIDELYDSPEQCRQDTALLHVNPQHSPPAIWFACDPDDRDWYRGNDRLHEKLAALGIPHTADLDTRAGGHSWAYFDALAGPMFDFVAGALDSQSRRLH